jgi:hypothetical protein
MRQLADTLLMVWIKGSDAHTAELVKRFDRAPKPMYYQPHFLHAMWEEYRATHSVSEETCDPDHFVRWTYARALTASRAMPRWRWGVTVTAEEVGEVASTQDFDALMARAIDRA